jgi:hypothetical protein
VAGAVGPTQIAAGGVSSANIAAGAVGPTQIAPSAYTPSGGRNGTATSLARGDHSHPTIISVAVSDFDVQFGSPTKTRVSYGTLVPVPAWTLPQAGSCVIATSVIPPGALAPPTIIVDVQGGVIGTAQVSVGSTGVAANAAPPSNCLNFGATQPLAFSVANSMQQFSAAVSTLAVCGSTPAAVAGPGDILIFRVCNLAAAGNIDFSVTSVELVWP